MITPKDGPRGIIGEQHGLARLTTTLEALSTGQQAQQACETAMQAQLTTQAQALARLQTWSQRLMLMCTGLGVLGLALGGVVGWQVAHPPQMAYARALGAVDTVLVQTWGSLPKPVQTQLDTAYERVGLTPPGQRK